MPVPLDALVAALVAKLDDDLLEDWEERAAIMEFDAQLPRGHAECLAMIDLLCRHPEVLLPTVTVLQLVRDGTTDWAIATDVTQACQRLAAMTTEPIHLQRLCDVLTEQFDGLALLTNFE